MTTDLDTLLTALYVGDKGFAGRDFEDLVTGEYRLRLVRPCRRDEAPRHGSIGWIRQWTESVNDTLNGQLDLERHGSRTTEGLYTRMAQRLLAMAACISRSKSGGPPASVRSGLSATRSALGTSSVSSPVRATGSSANSATRCPSAGILEVG